VEIDIEARQLVFHRHISHPHVQALFPIFMQQEGGDANELSPLARQLTCTADTSHQILEPIATKINSETDPGSSMIAFPPGPTT
jgi:hypothetical protein